MGITAHFSLPMTLPFRLSDAAFQVGAGGMFERCKEKTLPPCTTADYQNATSQGKEAKHIPFEMLARSLALKISKILRERL